MSTYLEYSLSRLPSSITTLTRFPASKVDSSLMSIIQSAMEGVIIVDSRRQIVLVNHKVERMFGYPAAHLLERPLEVLMPSRTAAEQRRRMDRLAAARISGRRTRLELKGQHANGELLSLNASISQLSVHGELFLAVIVHDAAACQTVEQAKQRPVRPSELRRWAVSSQQATEVEKRRFSKKLYDDIGQRLSVLKLDLDWLENRLSETSENLPARLAQMQGLLDNVITMTKSMASALRPPLLDDFGLLPAVEWMAENFRKKTGVNCSVESEGIVGKFDDATESAIFRVVQEGLSNIERHADASNAKIVLLRVGNRLDVMIKDDGIGMAPGSEAKPGCYGLIAMQERIFVLGGTISIRNTEPHGVKIHATIPLEPILTSDPISTPPTTLL